MWQVFIHAGILAVKYWHQFISKSQPLSLGLSPVFMCSQSCPVTALIPMSVFILSDPPWLLSVFSNGPLTLIHLWFCIPTGNCLSWYPFFMGKGSEIVLLLNMDLIMRLMLRRLRLQLQRARMPVYRGLPREISWCNFSQLFNQIN